MNESASNAELIIMSRIFIIITILLAYENIPLGK